VLDAHPLTLQPLTAATAAAASSGQPVNTPDTAGYVTTGQPGTYTAAAVSFTVPSLTQTVDGANAEYSAAIGGENNMIRVGITSLWTTQFSPPQKNIPFFELDSNTLGPITGQLFVFSPQVQAGDQIYASVDSNLNGDGISDVYVLDETTGVYSSLLASGLADGASAGCLVRLHQPGLPLANFGTVNLQCGVYEEGTPQMGPIGTYPNFPINMVNGGPGAITSDLSPDGLSFDVTWVSPNPGF